MTTEVEIHLQKVTLLHQLWDGKGDGRQRHAVRYSYSQYSEDCLLVLQHCGPTFTGFTNWWPGRQALCGAKDMARLD